MSKDIDTGGQSSTIDPAAVAERGRAHALRKDFRLPPGDPISHFGSGFASRMAANHFIGGLPLDFCAEQVGYFTAPYADRKHVRKLEADPEHRSVSVTLSNGVVRTARLFGSQGAITLPLETGGIHFTPSVVTPEPHPQTDGDWPEYAVGPVSRKLGRAVDAAFADGAMTAALVVTHRGRIVAERYGPGVDLTTPLES